MAFDFTKKTTSIKLPIRYMGFEWVLPESHATGFIIWLAVLIGSLSCVGIELRLDPFRIELLLPMIMSVVVGNSDLTIYMQTIFVDDIDQLENYGFVLNKYIDNYYRNGETVYEYKLNKKK